MRHDKLGLALALGAAAAAACGDDDAATPVDGGCSTCTRDGGSDMDADTNDDDAATPVDGGGDGPIQIVFQSKWFPQSQFAGYYVAGGHAMGATAGAMVPRTDGKSFYEEEGLDVIIVPGGDKNPSQEVAEGRADFGTDWIANMIRNIETPPADSTGEYEFAHLAQIFQRPGFEMVALASTEIESLDDFAGRRVGIWDFGNQFPAQVCLAQAGLTFEGDPDLPAGQDPDVETVTYAFDPAIVLPGGAMPTDVLSAMVYNELNQVVGLGYALDQVVRFPSAENDCGLLEDFVFTRKALLTEANFKDSGVSGAEVAARFVRATLKGWEWMTQAANQAQAVQIVLGVCGDTCAGSGEQTPMEHQTWQLQRVAELVQPGLLEGGTNRVIGCLDSTEIAETITRLGGVGFIREGTTAADFVNTDVIAAAGVTCP